MTIGPAGYGINPIGLRKRPTYEEAINYLANDQDIIRYPSREWKQRRESPWMTQLDADANDDYDSNVMNEHIKRNKMILEAKGLGISRASLEAARRHRAAPLREEDDRESPTDYTEDDWFRREVEPVPGVAGEDQSVHMAPPPMGGAQRTAAAAGVPVGVGVGAPVGMGVGVDEAVPIGATTAELVAYRARIKAARRAARELEARAARELATRESAGV